MKNRKNVAILERNYQTKSFAAMCEDNEMRHANSSGGVFWLLAKNTIEQGGLVFGAAFNENGEVIHKYCSDIDGIHTLMQSKYVQSDMNRCYSTVKRLLELKRRVLFCGTPCQISGLLSYLEINKIDDGELLTIDFICHGVPSRKVWRYYLAEISSGRNVKEISFRDKTNGWLDFSLKVSFSDGSFYFNSHKVDPFMQGFLRNLYLRPSCYECVFRGISRPSDITIGDFWGVQHLYPAMFDNQGTSIVMIHSSKGKKMIDAIKQDMTICEVDNGWTEKYNSAVIKSCLKHPRREQFFRSFNWRKKLTSKIITSYLQRPLYVRVKHKIYMVIKKRVIGKF